MTRRSPDPFLPTMAALRMVVLAVAMLVPGFQVRQMEMERCTHHSSQRHHHKMADSVIQLFQTLEVLNYCLVVT